MSKCILNMNNGADNILFKSGFLNENSKTLNLSLKCQCRNMGKNTHIFRNNTA